LNWLALNWRRRHENGWHEEGAVPVGPANLGWLLASNALMAVLSLVYIGMVTRALGLADFGRFALITGTAQMLAMLVSFETWKVVVQYGLEHEGAGRPRATWRLEQAAASSN
jgi:hypothetical protein